MELQTFPHAVIYHQAAAPGVAGGAPVAGQSVAESIRPSASGLIVLNDPEVPAAEQYWCSVS